MWKSDPNWFEQWFNSEEYHVLYGHRSQEEAGGFIQNLIEDSILGEEQQILDIGCGAGRHAAAMAVAGHHVTGVDLSANSILSAKQSFGGMAESLRFVKGDMRYIDAQFASQCFDVVTMMFTSFGYFDKEEEHLQTLRAIHAVLRPKGTFILDFLNLEKVRAELNQHEHIVRKGIEFEIHRRLTEEWIEKSIVFTDSSGERQHYTERVRAFSPQKLQSLLRACGFEIDAIFGNYDLIPLGKNSPRCIIVAR
tara:strand:+ start:1225 stop:1977 length:753 start_codon:yes stop_codon:yes gene_type:complete